MSKTLRLFGPIFLLIGMYANTVSMSLDSKKSGDRLKVGNILIVSSPTDLDKEENRQGEWAIAFSEGAKKGKTEEELCKMAQKSVEFHRIIKWQNDLLPAEISPLVDVNAFFFQKGDTQRRTCLEFALDLMYHVEDEHYKRSETLIGMLCAWGASISDLLPTNASAYDFLLPNKKFDKIPIVKKLFDAGLSMQYILLAHKSFHNWLQQIYSEPSRIHQQQQEDKAIEKFGLALTAWREFEQEKRKSRDRGIMLELSSFVSVSVLCSIIVEYCPCCDDQEYEAAKTMGDMIKDPEKHFKAYDIVWHD